MEPRRKGPLPPVERLRARAELEARIRHVEGQLERHLELQQQAKDKQIARIAATSIMIARTQLEALERSRAALVEDEGE